MDIFATVFAAGIPQNGLGDDPEIQISDDTGTIVQAFVAMTDLTQDGKYFRAFVIPDVARSYTFLVDADPNASVQVPASDRFYFGSFPGEADIIAVSTDLVNLDVPVSSRNAVVPLSAAADQAEHDATQAQIAALVVPLDAATDQAEHDATQAAIAAQVVPMDVVTSQAEHDATQAAIAAQVTPLDAATDQAEHDATQAAIAAQVVPMDAATSQAEHDATQVGIGLNLAAVSSLDTFIQGGREIDFVGDDAAGWQRVERSIAGAILRRYDLFDELDVRIDETVASFIGRSGMISRETISP
jgi:hypothetical protein